MRLSEPRVTSGVGTMSGHGQELDEMMITPRQVQICFTSALSKACDTETILCEFEWVQNVI